jgi:hypothetical protein
MKFMPDTMRQQTSLDFSDMMENTPKAGRVNTRGDFSSKKEEIVV